jgi:hypothetical protein
MILTPVGFDLLRPSFRGREIPVSGCQVNARGMPIAYDAEDGMDAAAVSGTMEAAIDGQISPAGAYRWIRLDSGRRSRDGAGAPGGASQGESPARGAPDPAPRSGAA